MWRRATFSGSALIASVLTVKALMRTVGTPICRLSASRTASAVTQPEFDEHVAETPAGLLLAEDGGLELRFGEQPAIAEQRAERFRPFDRPRHRVTSRDRGRPPGAGRLRKVRARRARLGHPAP